MLKKRILSVVLCLCMVVGMLPAITPTAQATGTGISDRLNQLRTRYPADQYWYRVNGVNKVTATPCPHYSNLSACGNYNGGWQCWAFASKIFYEVFNQNPNVFGNHQNEKNWSNVQPGDYVRFTYPNDTAYGHSFVVLEKNGSQVKVVENNTEDGYCRIRWDHWYDLAQPMIGYYQGKKVNYYFDYYCRASNYDEVNGTPSQPSVNLGDDFYAYINYDTTNFRLENHSDGNVQLDYKSSNDPRQIWHFIRYGNESNYYIENLW